MTVAAPPKPKRPPTQPKPEALIEEARRRTRRRRLKYAAAGLAALLVGGGVYAGLELPGDSNVTPAVPEGFHVVQAKGPVSHTMLVYFPSRIQRLDLATGETRTVERTEEAWWDRSSGLSRSVWRMDGDVQSDVVRNSCEGGFCTPPAPWLLEKTGPALSWPPNPCCAFIAGNGEFGGRGVIWVERLDGARRPTRYAERVGFDPVTHAPLVYEIPFGREITGYTISPIDTLSPEDVSFDVPNGGASRNDPSPADVVKAYGVRAARPALGVPALWLGRKFGGNRLRSVQTGTSAMTTARGVVRPVPFVRFDYGGFTLEEYGPKRPFWLRSGPGDGIALLAEPSGLTLSRDGVLMIFESKTRDFGIRVARALELASALRPLPAE